MSLRSIVLLTALVHASPALADLIPANEKATTLLNQGLAFEAEGKGNEALQRFRESALAREPDAWTSTLTIIDEAGKTDKIQNDGLRAMLRFHKAGQLKAAIFLLMYREAYRPDFEAWKKTDPAAIKGFIDTFQTGL